MSDLRFYRISVNDEIVPFIKDFEVKRKNFLGTEFIIHEEDVIEILKERNMMVLSIDPDGNDIETIPDLPYDLVSGTELDELLSHYPWKDPLEKSLL